MLLVHQIKYKLFYDIKHDFFMSIIIIFGFRDIHLVNVVGISKKLNKCIAITESHNFPVFNGGRYLFVLKTPYSDSDPVK